jgi:hypothetical protein
VDVLAVFPVEGLHAPQQVGEGGQAVARLAREIGAGEEGHLVAGGEDQGQRPAAGALGQQRMGGLVDLVQVGALLAVHLDVDEQLVHDRAVAGSSKDSWAMTWHQWQAE